MGLDVLVVAPHPDDAELGMGGTICRMLDDGMRVGVLDLTDGEPTPRGSPEIRSRETAAASDALGLPWREQLGLPNRRLRATLAARAALAAVIRREHPRWLFAPYWVDAHPDHVAATRLSRSRPVLGKADKNGHPWHAVPSREDFLLLVRPPAGSANAGLRGGHLQHVGSQVAVAPLLRESAANRRPTAHSPRSGRCCGSLVGFHHQHGSW